MDYIGTQYMLIKKYDVVLDPNSACWARTHAHPKTRRICKHTPKNSYQSLFTLLHEIGHIETYRPKLKRCESESLATEWAVRELRQLGLPVKRKVVDKYKQYIKMTYERGLRRGLSKKVNLYGVDTSPCKHPPEMMGSFVSLDGKVYRKCFRCGFKELIT